MKICFVTSTSPDFLGGVSMYHKNLINYLKINKNLEITWVYFNDKAEEYDKDNVHYISLKSKKLNPYIEFKRNLSLAKFFKNKDFDIINCQGGFWTFFYKKKENQKIIHTFHGTIYYFNKNQLKKFGIIKKILFSPILLLSKLLERPHKKADKIICVSNKVQRQVEKLYGKRDIIVIRTGVDLNEFRLRDKIESRNKLHLNKNDIYGLYIGGGGYWGKGLDRVIKISEMIYNKNKNYKLIVIGADYNKCKKLLDNSKCTYYMIDVLRKDIPLYYNSADIFFNLSRYEGGAPNMTTSEAMASGCLLICSQDSEQEIIINKENGLVYSDFDWQDILNIYEILNNETEKNKIINNEIKTVQELSLEKWGEKYGKYLK